MKPLHIIIDGSDNLGKTTLLNSLSKQLDLPILKMPNMKKYIKNGDVEEFSRLFNETIIQFAKYPFLMDRCYTSSLVYNEIFKRGGDMLYLEEIEQALDPIVIILTGRHKNAMDQSISYKSFCKDPIYNEEEKAKVDEEFCRLAKDRGYILIEVIGKTPLKIFEEVMNEIIANQIL